MRGWIPERVTLCFLKALSLMVLGGVLFQCGVPDGDVEGAPGRTGLKVSPSNLVIICLDTVRKDVFSRPDTGGPEDVLTPWVQRALRMEQAQSAAPWTVPSVASLLTGLYPNQHGAGRFSQTPANLSQEVPSGIKSPVQTLTQRFADRGFETVGFIAHPWFTLDYGLDRGFSDIQLRKSSEKLVKMGMEWIDERSSTDSAESTPFFLYFHFMEAHERHRRPVVELASMVAGESDEWVESRVNLAPAAICNPRESLTCQQWLAYGVAVEDLRTQVAEVLEGLKSRGLLQKTLVVLYSDHGEEFMDHQAAEQAAEQDPRGFYGVGHGQSLFQELLHVPLLVWHPSLEGVRISDPVSLIDMVPSLEQWFALEPIDSEHRPLGLAIGSMLEGGEVRERQLFSSGIAYGPERASVLDGNWKKISEPGGRSALLFDLHRDSHEHRPLPESKRPDLVSLLERYFVFGEAVPQRVAVDISPEKLKELQALGYLEGQ